MKFVLLIFACSILSCQSIKKLFDSCDDWAREGECINNPNFMWTQCQPSCMEFAPDKVEKCSQWANEGECTGNAKYIQLNCPESCRFSVGWSPWARKAAGIDRNIPEKALDSEPVDKCIVPVDLFSAANIMRNRLDHFVSGNGVSVPGLSSSAPSEFLGYYGLTEALLYATRLYHASFALLHAHANPFMPLVEEIETAVQKSRYNGDSLMRELPRWVAYLGELVNTNLPNVSEDPCAGSVDVTRTDIYHLARLLELGLPEDSEVDSKGSDTFHLHNGVLMPAVGLGTWQLNGEECEAAVTEALALGYRHIDSAQAYGNEVEIGRVLSEVSYFYW